MRYLIGVDDTDDVKSPGTAQLARRLAEWLQADRLAEPHGITRHQLCAHKSVKCTGHNSAVCLSLDAENIEGVWETARDFLALEAVQKANAGLCMGRWDGISREVVELGQRAKTEAITLDVAQQAASRSRLRTAGVVGSGNGIIGAVAAVGLHRGGNDGRFIWLPGLLEMQGRHSVIEILDRTRIDRVCSLEGREIPATALVDFGEWTRPLLRDGQATLFVEERKHRWYALDRERVKALSE